MARKIVVTGGKGGVGKSTVCLMLAKQLAFSGARVVVLDVDVGLSNLDVVAGIQSRIEFDVVDVIDGKVRLNQALLQDDEILDLYYLPSCHAKNVSCVSPQNLKDITKELSDFDYILLDCPAGIDVGFHTAVFCASEAIIVTTPNIVSISTADKVASLLCNYNLDGVGLVLNRVRKTDELKPKQIADALKLKLLGTFFESKHMQNDSIFCDSKLKNSVCELANNVFYGNYKIFDINQKRGVI